MAETRTVTVMFTDLVGSTALLSRLEPAEADRLRDVHFALLRGEIAEHGGTEVKNTGDGVMVVFSISSGALNCAEAMQQSIARHNALGDEPLSIRIGLAQGEATEDDGDFFGETVVEAARLCAAAEGGQILATKLVQLSAGRRAKQEFAQLGELELKGLPDPIPAVEVRWTPATIEGSRVPLPQRCALRPVAGFFGREVERSILVSALKTVMSEGLQRLVLIGGEPGMGKTSLATECARAAYDEGATVLFGRAVEDLSIPYGPWAEALTHLLTNASEEDLFALAAQRGALVRVAPGLGPVFGDDGTHGETFDPEAARYALFNAVTTALRAAGRSAPIVVVLDDLQWADAQSLQLVRHLMSSGEPVPVLIIGTFRESDVGAGTAFAGLLGALHREQGIERISLRGLSDDELLSMMEAAGGQELDADGVALRDALLAETDGNPFFTGELLRHLVETGTIYQEAGRWVGSQELRTRGLPVSVREVVGQRVARLGEEGTRVLSVASVIGRDFDLELVASASRVSEDDLLEIIDRATEATLVENVDGTRYSFVHALIEHTLYDSLSPPRRARLHRAVAEAIEGQSRGRTEDRAAELAYHWSLATTPDDLDKAIGYAKAAGDEALRRLAPDEALRSYGQAMTLLDQRGSAEDAMRCALLVGLGDARRQTGDPSYRETLLEAAQLAQGLGDTELLAAAALANNRGISSRAGLVDRERVAVLEAACPALDQARSARHARLLATLAAETCSIAGGSPSEHLRGRGLIDRAIEMAQSTDPVAFAEVAYRRGAQFYNPGEQETTLQTYVEAAAGIAQMNDPALMYWLETSQWQAHCALGRVSEGASHYQRAQDYARSCGQSVAQWGIAFGSAGMSMLMGDFEEAEVFTNRYTELASAAGEPDVLLGYAAQIGAIRFGQGRTNEIADVLKQLALDASALPVVAAFGVCAFADIDDHVNAREWMAPLVGDDFVAVPVDLYWTVAMADLAYAVERLGWQEHAATLIRLLLPYTDQLVFNLAVGFGSVAQWVGLLEAMLGHREEAERRFAEASNLCARNGLKWGLAMNDLCWGRYLVQWNGPGDRTRAAALLESSLAAARQHGYGSIERRATTLLQSLA